MMLRKYRIAVIGHTGRGNYGHGIDTVWFDIPGCEIVGVADADEAGRAAAVERLKTPKGYADYRQLLDETKPDIAAIGPRWLDQHRDMVVAAAERGIHVYMEKPFCRTPQEADEMVAACEKHKVKLAIAHQTRYSPAAADGSAVDRGRGDRHRAGTARPRQGRLARRRRGPVGAGQPRDESDSPFGRRTAVVLRHGAAGRQTGDQGARQAGQ